MVKNWNKERIRPHTGFYTLFGLLTYFIWCDLNFFSEVASEHGGFFNANISSTFPSKSMKIRMQDHFAHYIYLPFCTWFEQTFQISQIPGVTPNLITGIHFTFAVIAGRFMTSNRHSLRCIGVVLFETRSMLDTMDGVVYRAQTATTAYMSGWGTYGFIIDGVADTVGGIMMMIGVIYWLNNHRPFKNIENVIAMNKKPNNCDAESGKPLLNSEESSNEELEEHYGLKRYSKKSVNITIVLFTILIIVRSSLWDYFNRGFHELLATRRSDIPVETQWKMLGNRWTWFCLWLWKISSADAFIHYTMIAVLFNKLWKWMRFNIYFSIPHILGVFLICQIHLTRMRHSLGVSS